MLKLLLVDDERIIREGIEDMLPLEALNIALVGSYANAFDALDSMADVMPDILITDVKMRRMDGLELIEQALKLNPMLQCVVISGFDEFDFARRALKMGVREYLLKPCTKQELTRVLTTLCAEIRQRRQQASQELAARLERTAALANRLAALIPGEGGGHVQPEQVRAVAQATGEEALLREAFTYLLVHQEFQERKGYATIRQVFDDGGDCTAAIAQGLEGLQPPQSHGPRRSFVAAMCAYIQAHYQDEDLSLQFLADQVIHMRSDYIGREFVREMGCKLSTYLAQVRMEKAKELLLQADNDTRIYEVAEAVGLGHNPQYFSSLFRKYVGCLPREYGQKAAKNTKK